MMLPIFIGILLVAGLLAWMCSSYDTRLTRWISLIAVSINFVLILIAWKESDPTALWLTTFDVPWIPQFGIGFSFAMDGLSMVMLALTFFIGILAVLTSWNEVQYRIGFYHFNLLWVLAGITGVFLTMDLFLFYFFWEVMLIPMYFLIGIWGHENRKYAAYKFFLFTQASGLLMLLAILALYFIHGEQTGEFTYNYFKLLETELSAGTARWLMLGFLAAFIVKLPVVPFHSWLPDAHTEAPTAGSLILAGLLLKTGAYGLIRFVVPLFHESVIEFSKWGMLLGVIGILYGAKLAFAQTDFKRLVAYTSVSHMGFVMLGVFALNELAMQGVVMQMITHGISTGALFLLAGSLYERIHTRDISKMGGFWSKVPFMGTIALLFTMASLGLPGLGNFVAEFLTLIGSWSSSRKLTILAAVGLVAATIYSLRIMQKIFYGKDTQPANLPELNIREQIIFMSMAIIIIWLGLFPQQVLSASRNAVRHLFVPELLITTAIDSADNEKGGGDE
jgi:NADH-quinone oxidoreductase subunit M